MCAADDANGTLAMPKPVPASALAAALLFIAAGIVLVIVYGQSRKRAWAPQQTYSFTPDPSNSGTASTQCGETVLMALDDHGGPDGVLGLDDTLEENLISPNETPLNLKRP